jgi:hypothetical protein
MDWLVEFGEGDGGEEGEGREEQEGREVLIGQAVQLIIRWPQTEGFL